MCFELNAGAAGFYTSQVDMFQVGEDAMEVGTDYKGALAALMVRGRGLCVWVSVCECECVCVYVSRFTNELSQHHCHRSPE